MIADDGRRWQTMADDGRWKTDEGQVSTITVIYLLITNSTKKEIYSGTGAFGLIQVGDYYYPKSFKSSKHSKSSKYFISSKSSKYPKSSRSLTIKGNPLRIYLSFIQNSFWSTLFLDMRIFSNNFNNILNLRLETWIYYF